MTRPIEFTPTEILEALIDLEQATAEKIATTVGCSTATVRKKIKDLQSSGEMIGFNKSGYMYLNRELVATDPASAQVLADTISWSLGQFNGTTRIAAPSKPMLPALKKTLKIDFSREQRKALADKCLKVAYICNAVNQAEDDME